MKKFSIRQAGAQQQYGPRRIDERFSIRQAGAQLQYGPRRIDERFSTVVFQRSATGKILKYVNQVITKGSLSSFMSGGTVEGRPLSPRLLIS